MIYLHTLGDALIKVGEKEVRPNSPLVFAALLYLAMERGRRVPRAALQELLFPKADERSGAHSLRQLLYKLRRLGTPLECDSTAVMVREEEVDDDWHRLGQERGPALDSLRRGFAPHFVAGFSVAYAEWLDEARAVFSQRARTILVGAIQDARASGRVFDVGMHAQTLLTIDPLNEDAVLAHAESLALNGQKRGAMELLEDYRAEVGKSLGASGTPPELLGRRISKLSSDETLPLVGRRDEMAWLLAQFEQSKSGRRTLSVVWGDAGVGKTRLVQEFVKHATLQGALVVQTNSQAHDVDRPLGAFMDLVPQLLRAPGALGVSPQSLSILQRFGGGQEGRDSIENPIVVDAQIRLAIEDLLGALSGERPIALVIEDAQWLDLASSRLLLRTDWNVGVRLHVTMTFRGTPRLSSTRLASRLFIRRLEPLSRRESRELLSLWLRPHQAVAENITDECLDLARGNALFLSTIAEHIRLQGSAPSAEASLQDLLRGRTQILDAVSLLVLRLAAILGTDSRVDRLRSCSGLRVDELLLAVQDLSDRGLLAVENEATLCNHELLASIVLEETPQAIRVALFERAAGALEVEGVAGKQAQILWRCAQSWEAANRLDRAVDALRRCAAFALELGQPAFALRALEHALALNSDADRVSLLEETTRIADLACDFEGVLRSSAELLPLLAARGCKSPVSAILAETNAMRRMGMSVWARRNQLERFIRDAMLPRELRLRALRIFLVTAHQMMDARSASEMFGVLSGVYCDDIEFPTVRDIRMFYELYFGDLSKGRAEALKLLHAEMSSEVLLSPFLGNVGSALFHTGEIELGLRTVERAIALDEKYGLDTNLLIDCARIVDLNTLIGRDDVAELWYKKGEALRKRLNAAYSGFHLTNKIWLALRTGEFDTVQGDIGDLLAIPDARMPAQVRTVIGFELTFQSLSGVAQPTVRPLDDLLAIDDIGRQFGEHHVFAFGLFLTLCRLGYDVLAEKRLREYVVLHRRESYPLQPQLVGFRRTNAHFVRLTALVGALDQEVVAARSTAESRAN